ncbi:MAG TPA: di-heme oxidoredictase family protein [Dokdonella sp.]
MKPRNGCARLLAAVAQIGVVACANAQSAPGSAYADFVDTRDPPPYAALTPAQRESYDLGHALLNTQWVAAGTPRAERRDGLGPLFNAASCDACHNEGARGQGLMKDGVAPAPLVIQLQDTRARSAHRVDDGDPVYGHVLNISALPGYTPEGIAWVHYAERSGHYPDGTAWSLRVPSYELRELRYGALSTGSAISPRLAPPLFGVGLLAQVPESALPEAADHPRGRFGWQSASATLEQQTAIAMSREMGLTSRTIAHDDCTDAQPACRSAASGGTPEVSAQFMSALLAFQAFLAVPHSNSNAGDASPLFAEAGCAACHRPQLPVEGVDGITRIAAYSDLSLHDLGAELADRDAAGNIVPSRFRTAPLWGLGHALRRPLTLLHDGRARSIEEAILWHDGEALQARRRFEASSATDRKRLLDWLGTL